MIPAFNDIVKDYYGAEIYRQNSRTFIQNINSWCQNKTNGTIKNFLSPMAQYNPVALLNALYFKGIWMKGYKFNPDDTKKQTFKGVEGEWNRVDFMNQKNKMEYWQSDYAQMCALPFGNGAFSLHLILPAQDVDDCLDKLSNDGWKEFIAEGREIKINLSVPKFKVTDKFPLKDSLKSLGLNKFFDSDLEGITTTPITIGCVEQMSYFEMDEVGVKAATVTSIGGDFSAESPTYVELTFNKPFIYAIAERSTGVILFVGVIDKL